jgi:hypothetical protein
MLTIWVIGLFFIIYSEFHQQEYKTPFYCIKSDAMYYHEYIAVNIFDMPPYLPVNERKVNTYTMGMATTYLPGIAIGYVITEIKGTNHDFGRNLYYQHILFYLGLVYALAGFLFLRKILLKWCNEWVAALTIAILFFGTNLYYYINNEPLMSHAVNFGLITGFIFYVLQLIEKPRLFTSVKAGIFLGLLSLIRPVNIILVIFPLIYLFSHLGSKQTLAYLKSNGKLVLPMIGMVVLAFIPQMVYWHQHTGEWLYYSYTDQKFFFSRPAIAPFLFSFRKGWLIYTPMMLFIIPGAIVCFKKHKALFWTILIFSALNIYILSSWWCWWYGGSFGMRPMIDSYGILGIWIALFFQYLFNKSKILLGVFIMITGFFVYLNLFQTRQAKIAYIHYDSMTRAAYWKIFLNEHGRKKYSDEQWETLLSPPDYDSAKKGNRFW